MSRIRDVAWASLEVGGGLALVATAVLLLMLVRNTAAAMALAYAVLVIPSLVRCQTTMQRLAVLIGAAIFIAILVGLMIPTHRPPVSQLPT